MTMQTGARPRFTHSVLAFVAIALLALTCSRSADARVPGAVSVIVAAELVGSHDTYPLQDATVTISGMTSAQQATTDAAGRVLFDNLPSGQLFMVRVDTDFAQVTDFWKIDGNTVWSMPVPLPESIEEDELRSIIFGFDNDNRRWARGSTVAVYFDYTGGQNLSPTERRDAEEFALREFEQWFDVAPGSLPPLHWGGRAATEAEANVIVHMMHDEAFYARFPDDAGSRTAGKGGGRFIDSRTYYDGGEIWVRVDCCARTPGIYAHELGHVLGFRHPASEEYPSVMTSSGTQPGVASADLDMLRVKMHIPAFLPYDRHAPSEWSVDPRSEHALQAAADTESEAGTPWTKLAYAAGTTVDGDGRPLAGVSIVSPNGTELTVSDAQGRWSRPGLPAGADLSASTPNWTFSPESQRVHPDSNLLRFVGQRQGESASFSVSIRGPEGLHPLEDVTVRVGFEQGRTDENGLARLHHLEPFFEQDIVVMTDFGEFRLGFFIPGLFKDDGVVIPLEIPAPVGPVEFLDGVLGGQDANVRWERGATLSIYFDYARAPHMSQVQRRTVEERALQAFQAWLEPIDPDEPHLNWQGKVADSDTAAVIIHVLDDSAFFREFPDAGKRTTYTSRRWTRDDSTLVRAELFLRAECCETRHILADQTIYTRAAGHMFGLGRLPSESRSRSAMQDDLDEPTVTDVIMLRLKMHLPAGAYDPSSSPGLR